jgi:hypothetical protein
MGRILYMQVECTVSYPCVVSQKFLNKVRPATPTYPPPSRGREVFGLRVVPLPWWEGLGEGGLGNLFEGFVRHDTSVIQRIYETEH